jgi:hypothetical protein
MRTHTLILTLLTITVCDYVCIHTDSPRLCGLLSVVVVLQILNTALSSMKLLRRN